MEREDPRSVSLPVICVKQPIGTFYIGCLSARKLREITWFDIRRILRDREAAPSGLDEYLGIQRTISDKRVKEIKEYVLNSDATFPTGIIIAVEEECAKLETRTDCGSDKFAVLTLSNFPDPEDEKDRILYRQIAKVIDGQHRIEGLQDYLEDDFELNVVVFIGADISDQASIFSTVNLAQTKVNKSLVYDLFSLAKARSPQKTCHEIAVALDRSSESPFYNRIKRLGVATEGRFFETLSQATFVKALMRYISVVPEVDQRELKANRRLSRPRRSDAERLIFRNLFIEGSDEKIANILWNYFGAVQERWPTAWSSTGKGNILARTNGFNALMRFLKPAYRFYTSGDDVVTVEQFLKLFKRIEMADDEFTTLKYKPGTSGETDLYHDLLRLSDLPE